MSDLEAPAEPDRRLEVLDLAFARARVLVERQLGVAGCVNAAVHVAPNGDGYTVTVTAPGLSEWYRWGGP